MQVERYLGIQFRAQEHKFSKMVKTVATFNIYATETSDAVLKKNETKCYRNREHGRRTDIFNTWRN